MKVSMIRGISNLTGRYETPTVLLTEVSAESGFATSEGISTGRYVDGEEF